MIQTRCSNKSTSHCGALIRAIWTAASQSESGLHCMAASESPPESAPGEWRDHHRRISFHWRERFKSFVLIRGHLSVGMVFFTAEVKLNGQPLPKFLAAHYRTGVIATLREGQNSLEIVVTPALRNRFMRMANKGDPHYEQFKRKDDSILPPGLLRPAEVWQIRNQ